MHTRIIYKCTHAYFYTGIATDEIRAIYDEAFDEIRSLLSNEDLVKLQQYLAASKDAQLHKGVGISTCMCMYVYVCMCVCLCIYACLVKLQQCLATSDV